jgi:hypothetical protein
MFGVMLILPIPCLFVLVRISTRLRVTWRPSWYLGISSLRQVVPLITFSLPNNVLVNHCGMLRLIWWDLIGFPRLVYSTPCLPLNIWVVLLLLYLVLGLILHYDHVSVILLFYYCSWQDHYVNWTWSLTWDICATTRVEWDAFGCLIRKANGGLPYPTGARAVEELRIGRFLGRSCCDGF